MEEKDNSQLNEKTKQKAKTKNYGADQIQILESIEAIRTRPGMYIGDTSTKGLHHLINEVVDNSVDEHVAGNCDNIIVRLNPDDSVTIRDDGAGVPVALHKTGKPAVEVVFTKLHAGAKFGDEDSPYKTTGGLHGVGVTAVNAVSEWMEVKVHRDGKIHQIEFSRGHVSQKLKVVGNTDTTGTIVTFKPDPAIFTESTEFSFRIVVNRCRELAFLNPGLGITVIDDRSDEEKKEEFLTKEGLKEFVKYLNENKHEVVPAQPVYFSGELAITEKNPNLKIIIELAFQQHNGYDENIYSYCNNIHTFDGGTHLTGFRTAITASFNSYLKDNKVLGNKEAAPEGQDYREGMTAVISIKHPNPSFESQTKVKLVNPEVAGIVQKLVNDGLKVYLEENPAIAKQIIKRASRAAEARKAARLARDRIKRKDIMSSVGMPGKLSDCHSRDNEKTEVFIVEGDSAGGSAKSGRNSDFQAILPLRGKILNVEKATPAKMMQHQEIKNIVQALGVNISAIREGNEGHDDYDDKKRRYGKVIIMTDADVDGSHIRTLLLTFFFRYMTPLVKDGRLYIAQPPLFKFSKKRSKKHDYVNSIEERDSLLLKWGIEASKLKIKNSDKVVEGAALSDLLKRVGELEKYDKILRKKQVSLKWFICERDQTTLSYPMHIILDKEKPLAFHSDYALEEFLKNHPDIKLKDEFTSSFKGDKDALVWINLEKINKKIVGILNKIEALGFKPELIVTNGNDNGNGESKTEPAPFILSNHTKVIEIHTLWDVLKEVRSIGGEDLEIGRFKGLGEMNAQELWDTTMDPDKRQLYRVELEDAIQADRIFTVLMGSEVEPRRDYIEKNAADVKNLDI